MTTSASQASPGTDALLQVCDLHVEFARAGDSTTQAVRGISFAVGAAETVGLVGESGSGKSVTALSVLGLLPAAGCRARGAILWNGEDLLRAGERRLRSLRGNDIAMIFQEPMTSLNPVIACGEQVAEAFRLHHKANKREARQRALHAFERVHLPEPARVARSYPHQLSGGMRQRVMIAMALACGPRLLIADEPTTALDVTIQAQILALLRELQQQERLSILLITHDLGVVGEMADRIEIMQEGRIVESGAARRVFAQPAHDYTRRLLEALPGAPGRSRHRARAPVEATSDALLQVRDLHVQFVDSRSLWGTVRGTVHAVDGVSLELRRGETLGIVGESGSGKSTLARAILQLVRPTSGSVRFDGHDLAGLREPQLRRLRRRFQIVFQDPFSSLNPRLRVGDAIAEVLRVHRIVEPAAVSARVADLLQRVGLPADTAGRFPHEFSGGERQRLVIARALSLEPSLLVCDEPVSSLDVSIQAQILDLLAALQEQLDIAYVFISHDIRVVREISDRVAVMYQGRFVEEGPAEQVLEDPQEAYTSRLVAASPPHPSSFATS